MNAYAFVMGFSFPNLTPSTMIGRRLFFYFVIALVTLAVILYIRNPDLLNDLWLWAVGLFATLYAYVETLWDSLRKRFTGETTTVPTRTPASETKQPKSPVVLETPITGVAQPASQKEFTKTVVQAPKNQEDTPLPPHLLTNGFPLSKQFKDDSDDFEGRTIHLLRFTDDGETTLGLLFIDDAFFCYTLEDSYHDIKIKSRTRIPAGTYEIKFNKNDTGLTLKYRKLAFTQGWFKWHLQLQDVPQFEGIYIHSGGSHEDTAGCILISDGLRFSDEKKVFTNSKKTFESFYKLITKDLDEDIPVRIKVLDEKWIYHLTQNPS